MSGRTLEARDMARLIRAHFGDAIDLFSVTEDGGVSFLLYDALLFRASPDSYGSGHNWGLGLEVGEGLVQTRLLGTSLTILSTAGEIGSALRAIERYARLRLGPDYMAAFETATVRGS